MKTTTWKTIHIGSVKDYQKAIKDVDMYISSYANELLDKLPEAKKEDIGLVCMSVRELGFTEYPTTTELFARIKEIGELCPGEVGPALRLAYTDQPPGKWVYLAMEPITDSVGDPSVFRVKRDSDGEQWLDASWAGPGGQWGLDGRIVFRLRKDTLASAAKSYASSTESLSTLSLDEAIGMVKEAGYKVIKEF